MIFGMYDNLEYANQWEKKYRDASRAFIAMGVLGVLVFIGAAFALSGPVDEMPGGWERLVGLSVAMAGMTLVVGAGLVKRWRWAAVIATLWCLVLIVGNIAAFAERDGMERSRTANQQSKSFQAGRDLGTGCPGVLTFILLIICGRAALAKAPRKEELDVDPDLAGDFGVNPYGRVTVEPAGKLPAIALAVIGAGAFVAIGGAGLFAKGFIEQSQAATLDDAQWQVHEGLGFTVEFPGSPRIRQGVVPGDHITTSSSYTWSSTFHYFEVVHYRIDQRGQVRDDGLELELNNLARDIGGSIVSTSTPRFPNASALRYVIENHDDGTLAVVLGVIRGKDVYIVIGQEGNPDESAAAEHFTDSFRLR
jgi:hypothetical protein